MTDERNVGEHALEVLQRKLIELLRESLHRKVPNCGRREAVSRQHVTHVILPIDSAAGSSGQQDDGTLTLTSRDVEIGDERFADDWVFRWCLPMHG